MALSSDGSSGASEATRASGPRARFPQETLSEALSDPILFETMKKRLLELIEILGRHGPISLEEVAAALGKSSEYIAPERLEAVKEHLAEAEARLTLEKASREYHEDEIAELESSLTLERDLVKESLLRIARLERQLKDAQRTTVKLIAASRSSLANLKRVRAEFVTEDFAQQALNPLVRDLEQVAQTIQELHTLALVRAAPAPVEAPGP